MFQQLARGADLRGVRRQGHSLRFIPYLVFLLALLGLEISCIQTAQQPGPHTETVRILNLSNGCFVYPPAVVVKRGETDNKGAMIEFRIYDTTAVVRLPRAGGNNLFHQSGTPIDSLTLAPGQASLVQIRANAPPGVHRYRVIKPDNVDCRGFSGPIIIIE
jgi:hypothetical protein